MDAGQFLGLTVFASYFLLILALFWWIGTSLRWKGRNWDASVFLGLAVASFAHTWYYMFKFMNWSFHAYEHALSPSLSPISLPLHLRIANWLSSTGLFEQAWLAVCAGPTPWSWWWSQQLCLYTTGAWTLFLAREGPRRKIPHVWAYMLLGQLVAISVASSLFFMACTLYPPVSPRPRRAGPALWISTLGALASVALVPYLPEHLFLLNLLTMHALLVLPLLLPSSGPNIPLNALRRVFAASAAILHLYATAQGVAALPVSERTLGGVLSEVVRTLYHHPAQSSIGWDVVWTGVAAGVWYVRGRGVWGMVGVLGKVGVCGLGGFVLEEEKEGEMRGKED